MGMNIQKSAGVKADTFILKRNNMDRWIRMDVAMLIILAICTRLVAGIMNVEKMDAYTGSGEGFCKAVTCSVANCPIYGRNNSGSKRCSGSKRRESCMGKYGLRENRDHNAGNSYG